MRGIPNSGTWQKIGRNERLGVPSTKWLSLTPERFLHHTRPTFTRSTLLRGQVPHTARNKRSAVACHFLPAILALFGKIFTRKCTDFWGYRVDWVLLSRIVLALWKNTGSEYLMSRFGELAVPLWKHRYL